MSHVRFLMLVGLPGSGKSYYANLLKEKFDNVHVFSSDELRLEMTGDENNQNKNGEVFNELHKRIKQCIRENRDKSTLVIYDACNISYKRRMAFLRELKNYECRKICMFIYKPYVECLADSEKRAQNGGRYVPEEVIDRMHKNIYVPYYFEGWDTILMRDYSKSDEPKSIPELFYGENGLCKIPHDNPHHEFTIGDHCVATMMNLIHSRSNYSDNRLILAGLLHDIGKRYTKSFIDSKGEKSETAHYYQHHLVGAYDAIEHIPKGHENERFEVANLIQYHMFPFFWNKEVNNNKVNDKYKKMWGERFYERIMLLHKADRLAH